LNRGKKRQKKLTRSTESPQKSFQRSRNWKSKVIDVRKDTEYSAEHVEEAFSKPLASINDWIKISILKNRFPALCRRIPHMIAASILQARGFRNFKEIEGGFNAIAKTELPKTDFVCQTKIL
jgi:rhodanese-related sulfurtransferase